jgi:CRISPR-associated protein Cas1
MTSDDDGGRPVGEAVPALVPARMLNEFTYCRRLFFLEWVQSQWASNDDTAEGDYAHRNVDSPTGRAPLPDDDGELRRARSVTVSSERLGLVAVIDVVEGVGGVVRPVDTKKGDAPATPEGAWEPERVQVCAQGLLLRDQGYQCDEGVIYFAGNRQRVTVPFDDALVTRTLELLRELRLVAARDLPPPPLVDSPKCPRCSLVGICLPDETNALAGRQQLPLRRLLPRDPAERPLYVTEQGAVVGRDGGRVEIRYRKELIASSRLIDVSQVCVFGNVQVSTPLLRELFTREVPILWFTYGGWFSGIAHGLPSKHVELRRRQVAIAHQGGLAIARAMIEGKVRNARTLLRRNARGDVSPALEQMRELIAAIPRAASIAALLGHEGAAARSYFAVFAASLRSDLGLPGRTFAWDGRNRRPPRDAINCLLSYAYALLVKDFVVATLAVGFDPYLGFYHRPRFGRPALALDLAEEFRPLVADSLVINLINNGEIRPEHFVVRAGGVALTSDGRRSVIRGYERRLDVEISAPFVWLPAQLPSPV